MTIKSTLLINTIICSFLFSQNYHISNKIIQTKYNHPLKNTFTNGLLVHHKKLVLMNYQKYYLNSNLPNFENMNGEYYPKGFGFSNSMLIAFSSEFFSFTFEPISRTKKLYKYNLPEKFSTFSVLNDVPIKNTNKSIINSGIELRFKDLKLGYGNWSNWWGPASHTSIVMSNNSEGFDHFYIQNKNIFKVNSKKAIIDYKYLASSEMVNGRNDRFYLTSFFFKVKYENIELGLSNSILSGGHDNISWSGSDALFVLFNRKNMRYWDTIASNYILVNFHQNDLEIFVEFGYPNRRFNNKNPNIYFDHSRGSLIGFRKKSIFDSKNLFFGIEYLRLIQSTYFDIMPSRNWYDRYNYNYSSYRGRRWAAHSGSDSDDLFIFFGYLNNTFGLTYAINFERHGVTYKFPPEVKIEHKISAFYKINRFIATINFENEYFEHYGFVDTNNNVWTETFEKGSLQRTNSVIISLDYVLF